MSVLGSGRHRAESRMTSTFIVGSFKDDVDASGAPIRVPVTTRYNGPGRIRWSSREVSNSSVAGSPAAMQEPYLSIPFDSPRLFVEDEVLCAESDDPMLVGRYFTIQGSAGAGQVTAYRYPLKELS